MQEEEKISKINSMTVNLLILAIGIYILIFESYYQIDTGWGRNITIFGGGSVLVGIYLQNLNKNKQVKHEEIPFNVQKSQLNKHIIIIIITGLLIFFIIFILNINKYVIK